MEKDAPYQITPETVKGADLPELNKSSTPLNILYSILALFMSGCNGMVQLAANNNLFLESGDETGTILLFGLMLAGFLLPFTVGLLFCFSPKFRNYRAFILISLLTAMLAILLGMGRAIFEQGTMFQKPKDVPKAQSTLFHISPRFID